MAPCALRQMATGLFLLLCVGVGAVANAGASTNPSEDSSASAKIETRASTQAVSVPRQSYGADLSESPIKESVLNLILPDFAKLQSGGWFGLATAGLGYEFFNDNMNLSMYYGFLPASMGGNTVHSLSWKLDLRPATIKVGEAEWEVITFGLGFIYGFGESMFLRLPNRYPRGYYLPTAVRLIGALGSEFRVGAGEQIQDGGSFITSQAAFVELVTIDQYFKMWITQFSSVPLSLPFSLAIGYRLGF